MKKLLLLSALCILASPAPAQDVEAMAKWTAYTIVHYEVVGEFSGETTVLVGSGQNVPASLMAHVTDRIEVEFDWDQQEFKLVGQLVIRNFPTELGPIVFPALPVGFSPTTCPSPKLDGKLEFVTGVAVKTEEALRTSGFVTLDVRRDQPGGSYPAFGDTDTCGEVWEASKAVSEASSIPLHAVPGMFLVMPDAGGGMNLSADRKSLIVPPGPAGASNHGWTWTYTPTGVR